ncbi:MAG: YaiI/YqxD family protein [Planctomycetes bacterium]|nr:YaiI/YqxD family protein [Planctomycetota bacterium]MBI3847382.1 YaiI/YqxD family protein [Planctomycetota bacterium]
MDVYIDADGCPVKDEVYRVAKRYSLHVFVVCNSWMRVPAEPGLERIVVSGDFDAADNWIAEQVKPNDVVISGDIPLASRCLKKGARVLGTTGREFTEDGIGDALATRELLSQLRMMGTVTGGPAPFSKQDRSRFLQELDRIIQAVRRAKP